MYEKLHIIYFKLMLNFFQNFELSNSDLKILKFNQINVIGLILSEQSQRCALFMNNRYYWLYWRYLVWYVKIQLFLKVGTMPVTEYFISKNTFIETLFNKKKLKSLSVYSNHRSIGSRFSLVANKYEYLE